MMRADPERRDILTAEIGSALVRHYQSHAPTPASVYEALEALAYMSATVIVGAEGELLDRFLSELSRRIEQLRATAKKATLQ